MTKRKAIPAKIRLKVLQRDNFTCQSCGKSPALYPELLGIDAFPKLEIDHFDPHSKGGSDEIDNLQTLCI
ncbi:HNH endonuclease, partial [candidate division WWE3 bacterium]|nr:HNH endonuclease [candidate division WWE3 bacterium]